MVKRKESDSKETNLYRVFSPLQANKSVHIHDCKQVVTFHGLDLYKADVMCLLNLPTDFGFAQHMTHRDEKHVLRGSPLYMAPEMVCNRQYDARVDLWSVGVILYGKSIPRF